MSWLDKRTLSVKKGHQINAGSEKHMPIRALIGAILVLSAASLAACREQERENSVSELNQVEALPVPGVTLANYDRLGTGAATYEDTTRALGSPGKVQSSAEMGGKKTATYSWKSDDESGQITAIFENERLISKSQYGLK